MEAKTQSAAARRQRGQHRLYFHVTTANEAAPRGAHRNAGLAKSTKVPRGAYASILHGTIGSMHPQQAGYSQYATGMATGQEAGRPGRQFSTVVTSALASPGADGSVPRVTSPQRLCTQQYRDGFMSEYRAYYQSATRVGSLGAISPPGKSVVLQQLLGEQSSAREWVVSSKMKPPARIHVPGRDRAKPDPSVASVLSTKRNPILKMHQSKTWFQRKADFARHKDSAHNDGAEDRDGAGATS